MSGADRGLATAAALPSSMLAIFVSLAGGAGLAYAEDAGVPVPEVRWERPPEGTLERGLHGVPEWVVIALGVLVVSAAAAALVAAARRASGRTR